METHRSDVSPGRPFVRLNVAESVDGKLAPVNSGKVNFGSDEDRWEMENFRADADGVIIGSRTLLAEDPPLIIRNPELIARRMSAKGSRHPKNICVCASLPPNLAEMRFFTNGETEKLVFTTSRTPSNLRDLARRYAQIEMVSLDTTGRVNLVEVVRRLPAHGINRLLLEGGGELNFSMLNAGFVDEVCITLAPFIFGGRSASTSFDGMGFTYENVRKLSLKSHRVNSHGEVFLRYDVVAEAATIKPSHLFTNGIQIS